MTINELIKALSWKEPYGSLMLPPHNKIETRIWSTKYRGLVLMCASKKGYPWDVVQRISGTDQFDRLLSLLGSDLEKPTIEAQAFAIGRLIACRHMTKEDEAKCFVKYRDPWLITNKKGQRVVKRLWCHIYEDVKPILPFKWKGSQGFGKVSQEVINQIQLL